MGLGRAGAHLRSWRAGPRAAGGSHPGGPLPGALPPLRGQLLPVALPVVPVEVRVAMGPEVVHRPQAPVALRLPLLRAASSGVASKWWQT